MTDVQPDPTATDRSGGLPPQPVDKAMRIISTVVALAGAIGTVVSIMSDLRPAVILAVGSFTVAATAAVVLWSQWKVWKPTVTIFLMCVFTLLGLASLSYGPRGAWLFRWDTPPAAATPSPSPVAVAPEPTVVILKPTPGTPVSGKAGVIVTGTASDVDDYGLWLFVISGDNAGKPVYYLMTGDPIPVKDGTWSTLARPIGAGDGDIGETFPIVIVRANVACNDAIRSQPENGDGDVYFTEPPAGCVEAARTQVLKGSA